MEKAQSRTSGPEVTGRFEKDAFFGDSSLWERRKTITALKSWLRPQIHGGYEIDRRTVTIKEDVGT